ncbi:MAG TPA: Gfo/Idh/MocA family oxidoreductase [Kiritimatiellia bacterium]|nr:Gfo/Idh/MocA family oxidoreductase [Kiritimatiellia bacterium]
MTNQPMNDGMNYAPKGRPSPVCGPGDFVFAAAALDHGHIYGQVNGLREAGGTLKWVYDPDDGKTENFIRNYPECRVARSLDEILDDTHVTLVTAAAIPNERAGLGLKVMDSGKDYFTDKSPFTDMAQLIAVKGKVAETARKYMVYYSERLHSECAEFAGQLIEQGAIGRVIHVLGLGPHRLNAPSRPSWFFQKEKYGGILTDIGSHQCEQFLYYSGAVNGTVSAARATNHNHPDFPELEDFGEANIVGDNGSSFYFRVDWFTPDGLRSWGDGRTFIQGTDGYIELRKYVDIGSARMGDQLYLVNQDGEQHIEVAGKVGFPFFGRLIQDCLYRTENAMTQEHAFKAAELSLLAQELADKGRQDI